MPEIWDFGALLVVSALFLAGAAALPPQSWPQGIRKLVVGAVAVRIVGSLARLWVVTGYYGRGDALRYYENGLEIAAGLRVGDLRPFLANDQLWGSTFVDRVSALVLLFIGPSIRAEFLVFSMFPLVGLLLILVTFIRAFRGRVNGRRMALLVLFWPSLVFWPSSIGKEAIVLLAVGLVVYGYYGNGQKIRFWPLLSGMVLVIGIRPHIAMMLAVCLGAAEWLAPARAWTLRRVIQGVILSMIALFTVSQSLSQFGLDSNVEAVQEFVEFRSGQTAQGGSRITQVGGVMSIPMAFINVLLRPFPWEVRNPLMVMSSLEIILFWGLVWRRRSEVLLLLRDWRRHRLLLFVVPLTVVLVFFYGAFVSNLGILARQRVIVLPFLFLLAESAVAFSRGRHADRAIAAQSLRMFGART